MLRQSHLPGIHAARRGGGSRRTGNDFLWVGASGFNMGLNFGAAAMSGQWSSRSLLAGDAASQAQVAGQNMVADPVGSIHLEVFQ